ARLEMVAADDAEKLRLDRLAGLLHHREQLGDAGVIDPVGAEEAGQGFVRAADLVEGAALHRRSGGATKLRDELAPRGALPEIAIPGHMGGEIALQPGLVVPVR